MPFPGMGTTAFQKYISVSFLQKNAKYHIVIINLILDKYFVDATNYYCLKNGIY